MRNREGGNFKEKGGKSRIFSKNHRIFPPWGEKSMEIFPPEPLIFSPFSLDFPPFCLIFPPFSLIFPPFVLIFPPCSNSPPKPIEFSPQTYRNFPPRIWGGKFRWFSGDRGRYPWGWASLSLGIGIANPECHMDPIWVLYGSHIGLIWIVYGSNINHIWIIYRIHMALTKMLHGHVHAQSNF